jgi:hypothetical protein
LASAIADNIWWWQAGMGVTDSTQTAMSYLSEIAAGDVTNKITCLDHHIKICTAAEQGSSFPLGKCQQDIPSGANVYARSAASSGAGDTGRSIAAYGLGG